MPLAPFGRRLMATASLALVLYSHAVSGLFKNEVPPPREIGLAAPNVTDSMMRVQDMLSNINDQPTCQKQASMALINSCKVYDSRHDEKSGSTDEALELYQSLYQIRMARCHLEFANRDLPSACGAVLDSPVSNVDGLTKQALKRCLDAVYEDTNQWTSYTNAKTDSLIMCHTIRFEADKDEHISILNLLLRTVGEMSGILGLQREDMDRVVDITRDIRGGMRDFLDDFLREHHELKTTVKDSFDQIQNSMMLTSHDMKTLLGNMHNAKINFDSYSQDVKAVIDRAAALSTDVETWRDGVTKAQDELEEVGRKHQLQMAMFLDAFSQQMYAISNSVEFANNATTAMAVKLERLHEDLDAPMGQVSELRMELSDLLRMQDSMRSNAVETDAAVQQTWKTVQDMSEKVQSLGGVLNVVGSVADLVGGVMGVKLSTLGTFGPVFLVLFGVLINLDFSIIAAGAAATGFGVVVTRTLLATLPSDTPVRPTFTQKSTIGIIIIPIFSFISGAALMGLAYPRLQSATNKNNTIYDQHEYLYDPEIPEERLFCEPSGKKTWRLWKG